MMYFANILPKIRIALNDTYSASYRYTDEELRQHTLEGVREIYRIRPDSKIKRDGSLYSEISEVYEYTDNIYLTNFKRLINWDKYLYPILYLRATASDTITGYVSSADRIADTNAVFTITNIDISGVRAVRESNDSNYTGTLEVLVPIPITTDIEIEATEYPIQLDEIFMSPLSSFAISKAFGSDNEDTYDGSLEQKYYNEFLGGLKQ